MYPFRAALPVPPLIVYFGLNIHCDISTHTHCKYPIAHCKFMAIQVLCLNVSSVRALLGCFHGHQASLNCQNNNVMISENQPLDEAKKKWKSGASSALPVKKQILIVDTHPVFREGLKSLIQQQTAFNLACTMPSVTADHLEKWPGITPDVILMEVSKDQDALNTVSSMNTLHSAFSQARFLAIVENDTPGLVVNLLQSGVTGIVTRNESKADFVDAIDQVSQGRPYLNKALAHKIMERAFPDTRTTI